MKQYNLLKKATAVATTATMLLSTTPITALAVEDDSYKYYLEEQTITDDMTGITVTGRLPFDCDMHVYVNFLQSTTFTDLNDSNSGISTLEDTEADFPKRGGKPVTTMTKPLNWEESTKDIINENLIPQIHIAFSYDSKILDFDSSLLVTVPYDFYTYYGEEADNNQVAVFCNGYSEDDTKGLKVVDKDRVRKNSFTFKADAPGSFYIGNYNSLENFAAHLAVTPDEIAIPESNNETTVINAYGYSYDGVTVETPNPKHLKAYVETSAEFSPFAYAYDRYEGYKDFSEYKEDYMKEMFYIYIDEEDPSFMYGVEQGIYDDLSEDELKNNDARTFETTIINENVKISIPSDTKDLYVINVNDPYMPYQIDAEYIDGKYVFETDELGYFMLSSQPLPEYKAPVLTQQTITDEYTGITVSGLLPTNAKSEFNVIFYSNLLYTDFMDFDNTAHSFNHPRYALSQSNELYTTVHSSEHISWNDLTTENSVNVQIVFRDGLRMVDFSSDLTVTLPHGFNYFLRENIQAYKINYKLNKLNPVEILQSEDENTFTFKANSEGSYLIGVKNNLDYILHDAYASIDETMEATPTLSSADQSVTTEVSANVPFIRNTLIAMILGVILLATIVTGIVVIVTRKNKT